jgi:hypothetical protein
MAFVLHAAKIKKALVPVPRPNSRITLVLVLSYILLASCFD